jgi:hypothetical protein
VWDDFLFERSFFNGLFKNTNMNGDPWNIGWNTGWNVGYNARKNNTGGSITPTPVPTPTIYQQQGDPWNVGWNTGWNVGYNDYQSPQALADTTGPAQTGGTTGGTTGNTTTTTNTGSTGTTVSGPDYTSYYNQLDQMMTGLGDQRTAQEGIARNTFTSGENQLNTQLKSGQQSLEKSQNYSLTDIGNNIRNAFETGNNMLGTMGAYDSSATRQYAYALSKEASKQRGLVMRDISDKQFQLKQAYDSGVSQLKTNMENQVLSIASWFAQSQNALRGQRAEVAKQQSDQALQIALQQLGIIQQQAAVQRTNLESWAMSRSQDISSLISNMATVGSYQTTPQQQQQYGMTFAPTSASQPAPVYGGGYATDQKKQTSLFPKLTYLS